MTSNQLLENLKNEYDFIRVINKDKSRIFFLRNKRLGKKAVLKIYKEHKEIYAFLKRISFQNLPTVYDTYDLSDGFSVLEEYVDGVSVAEVIECGNYRYSGAKKVINDVCDALNILHINGFVHRDIKPENIMISVIGEVKLIDFDVSRKSRENISRDTEILGTVGYASPEQIGIAQTGPAADIYALGVLLNVMLTGKHPSEMLAHGKARRIILRCTQISP